jgi:hypothetical protein
MHGRLIGKAILVALACLVLLPLAASAQSSIAGVVRDESGGVLPGVTVEAASPMLIEKVRTVVTDERGRYQLIDLRPGSYRLTFSLTGFSTVVREGMELPANFTATVNADLKVGSLQESVTVSGAAPVVDVQQASKTQVLTRDLIDTLPTSRNILSISALVPGVRQERPDIGGSAGMQQTYMRSHGIAAVNNTQQLDGMMITSQEGNGQMAYWDEALTQEASVTTSAIPAETQGGGLRINIIPKDGGNGVSGTVFLGGSIGTWQADNIDADLKARGIATANSIAHIQNFNGALGGPVKKDKIWFLASVLHSSTDEIVANQPKETVLPDGTIVQTTRNQFVRSATLRMTWQVNSKNKVAGMFERIWKRLGKDFTYGADPLASQQRDPTHGIYGPGQAKWTSTVSSKFLLEGGYSTYLVQYTAFPQPEIVGFARGTANWYAYAQKGDTALNKNFYPQCSNVNGCTSWMSTAFSRIVDQRHVVAASGSYVTGTHNIKAGFQDSFGYDWRYTERYGDLQANYVNNRPQTVTVYNTPMIGAGVVDYDIGLYAQDTWTIKRLTLNPGVRVNWFKSGTPASSMGAGRFAPARYFAAQEGIPTWGPDWTPRLSAAYDVFGDGTTAIKGNYSKYYRPWAGGFALNYANAVSSTDSRSWFDADLIPGTTTISGAVLPTNNDGIAQDNEIGPSSSTTFGLRSDRNPADGIQNYFNWESSLAVQRQLMSGVSITGAYFHRTYSDLHITDRTLITSADYTSFTTTMPDVSNDPTLTGVINPNEILTVYNLNSAKRSVYSAAQVDYNSTGALGGAPDQSIYNGFEFSFSARLPKGMVLGGLTVEKNTSRFCDYNDDPNGVTSGDLYSGGTVSRGGRFCDQTKADVPFRQEFKLSGSYPLPYGVDFGAVWQSYPGSPRTITWQPAASLFPGGRTNSETIVLTPPGTVFLPRFSQLDINFKKTFRSGPRQMSLQVDLFNALNANPIFSTTDAVGSTLGQVTAILQGRMPRLAFQMKW